jgi:DNA anti-recombination protein RmuC
MSGEQNEILMAIGKLTATVDSLQRSIDQSRADNNQRLDSLSKSLGQRMEDLQKSTEQRIDVFENHTEQRFVAVEKRLSHVEEQQSQLTWKIVGFVGLGGALVTAVVEGLKYLK